MHYYKRNIGDYAKKAGRLTMLQHGAYTLLIDACYDREDFPTLEQALEWTWASTEAEVEAVKFVLSRFFSLCEDNKYVQLRILEEVLIYHKNAETNKRIAIERETKRKEKSTKREQTVDESDTNFHLTINHKPLTNNHKPNKLPTPDGVLQSVWDDFVQHRKNKKAPITETALKGIEREAKKAQISLNDALQEICARGWTGFKAEWVMKDQPKKTEHQLRQDATAKALFGEQVMEVYDANNTRLLG